MDAVAELPARSARTQRFTLGAPRSFTASPDGERVTFLRAAGPEDPWTSLWVLDTATGEERVVADVARMGAETTVTAEERVRRERARDGAAGITGYVTDDAVRRACFAVGGQLFVADLVEGTAAAVGIPDRVADPRLDPAGEVLAFATGGGVATTDLDGVVAVPLIDDDDGPDVTWGQPEFVAAEEMDRSRGFWWAPDSSALAVARVDVRDVQRWHLADPIDPAVEPMVVRYPHAGSPNADVTLHVVRREDRTRTEVRWDRATFPYLADVVWGADGPLTLVVVTRDQRTLRFLAADPDTGVTRTLREDHDRDWVDLVPGVPRWLPDGRMLTTAIVDGAQALVVGDQVVTPSTIQVRGVAAVTDAGIVITASLDPERIEVLRVGADGGALTRLSAEVGVAGASGAGPTLVVVQRELDRQGATAVVTSPHGTRAVTDASARSGLELRLELLTLGQRDLRAALLLPTAWQPGDGPLPVLMDPYGGPHAQRVLAVADGYLTSQWFAEQGFAVLVVDGRGTPGRGPAWERTVAGDLATPTLTDQVDGLHAAAEARPGTLDLERVAIRGWSFGGYLAALGVLRRPDVFHAAVAGAPVTDWRLYDTYYTERYLGDPATNPEAYARSSLLDDAASLTRPLLLIHGLADDNVVSAHTLRLSRALLEAGRPHTVLPLSGVSHMTPQAVVAEHLLRLQLAFLRDALAH